MAHPEVKLSADVLRVHQPLPTKRGVTRAITRPPGLKREVDDPGKLLRPFSNPMVVAKTTKRPPTDASSSTTRETGSVEQLKEDIMALHSHAAPDSDEGTLVRWMNQVEAVESDPTSLRLTLTETLVHLIARVITAKAGTGSPLLDVPFSPLETSPHEVIEALLPALNSLQGSTADPLDIPLSMGQDDAAWRAKEESLRRRIHELEETVASQSSKLRMSIEEQKRLAEELAMERRRSKDRVERSAEAAQSHIEDLRQKCDRLADELHQTRVRLGDTTASLASETQRALRLETRLGMMEASEPSRQSREDRGSSSSGLHRLFGGRTAEGRGKDAVPQPLGSQREVEQAPDRPVSVSPKRSRSALADEAHTLLMKMYPHLTAEDRETIVTGVVSDGDLLEAVGTLGEYWGDQVAELAAEQKRETRRLRHVLLGKDEEVKRAKGKLEGMMDTFQEGCSLVNETRSQTEKLKQCIAQREEQIDSLKQQCCQLVREAEGDRQHIARLEASLRTRNADQQQILSLQRELDEAITARLKLQSTLDEQEYVKDVDGFILNELKSMRDAFTIKLRLANREVDAMKARHKEQMVALSREAEAEREELMHRVRQLERMVYP